MLALCTESVIKAIAFPCTRVACHRGGIAGQFIVHSSVDQWRKQASGQWRREEERREQERRERNEERRSLFFKVLKYLAYVLAAVVAIWLSFQSIHLAIGVMSLVVIGIGYGSAGGIQLGAAHGDREARATAEAERIVNEAQAEAQTVGYLRGVHAFAQRVARMLRA